MTQHFAARATGRAYFESDAARAAWRNVRWRDEDEVEPSAPVFAELLDVAKFTARELEPGATNMETTQQ